MLGEIITFGRIEIRFWQHLSWQLKLKAPINNSRRDDALENIMRRAWKKFLKTKL
jgi:hypothetical protein